MDNLIVIAITTTMIISNILMTRVNVILLAKIINENIS